MTRARLRVGRLVGSAALLAVALVFGCQVLVTGDVPDFKCASADPSACPSGLTCDLATGKCVAPSDDAGEEEAGEAEAGPDTDARVDVDAGPSPLGTACRFDSECASGLCGTSAMLTPTITQGTGPVCTKTCCTSNDCDPGFLCFGAGTGGNYCVAGSKVGKTPKTNGTKAGAGCNGDGDCRSGSCVNNRCLDTCCSNTNCEPGSTCRVVSVALTNPPHDVWACAVAPGTKDAGVTCVDNNECRSNACVPTGGGSCRSSCCGKSSCATAGFPGSRCIYGPSSNDVYKLCFGGSGSTAVGAACQFDNECTTGYCDAELKQCADSCCVDADCPANQVCRPAGVQTPYLRCVAKSPR